MIWYIQVHIEETKGTLQFASRAKRITNRVQVNEVCLISISVVVHLVTFSEYFTSCYNHIMPCKVASYYVYVNAEEEWLSD